MPVQFKVAAHDANPFSTQRWRSTTGAVDILAGSWGMKEKKLRCAELLQSSLHGYEDISRTYALSNGFVNTVLSAYNQHHHLTIRPDDVWMSILSQFNFYVNAHAEELRSHFVQHEGKKELIVEAFGTRYTVDFGHFANQMTAQMDKHLNDKELKDWILPNFSTTTHNDTVICSVFMMSTFKAYFSYTMSLACGIPSVTLEGEKSDWENLLVKIDKLEEFGQEPKAWACLLRPILKRFVQAFEGQPDVDFWGRVFHHHRQGSGSSYYSGWITAFCVWDERGRWQGPSLDRPNIAKGAGSLTLDDVHYSSIGSSKIPPGYCEVDVKLDDNGEVFDCMMVAGHCAFSVEGEKGNGVRPLPAWFMFIKEEVPEDNSHEFAWRYLDVTNK